MPTRKNTIKTDKATGAENTPVALSKKENNKIIEEPLHDSDEIAVISLIPNVSYKDNKTNDIYEWDEVGHIEYMTVETLKNMKRNYKTYFIDLWLKPLDDRVIKQFGLQKNYDKYEFLMDDSNYIKENISTICNSISTTPQSLKYTIFKKVRDMVTSKKITDITLIRAIEKQMNLDLISLTL